MDGTDEPPRASSPRLGPLLERALLRELVRAYKSVNLTYFKGRLTLPTLTLSDARRRLGQWHPASRTLEIARPLVLTQPWGVVLEVLKHEMAHQFVHEVLGEVAESAHGPAFRATCERLGIDAAAAGVPRSAAEHDEPAARAVERIAKLLALAESPNQHEAEAAMAAAQRLMLKYNLDVAQEHRPTTYGFRHLGKASGRVGEHERLLAMILGRHFFVEVIWVPVYRPHDGKRASVLEVCGSSANLAMADYVHGFLLHTAEQLWVEHRRGAGIATNRDRRIYLAGVMSGFAEKLARQTDAHRAEGLVHVKDGDLSGFFRRRHPYVRHVRHAGQRKNEAYAHGKEAGKRIVLRRGVEAGSQGGGGPRLLPPRRSSQ